MQVFRDGQWIMVVNATANSYQDFRLWINQQYMLEVPVLAAGETIFLSLWDFRNNLGEAFNAGGILRSEIPTPVRMSEIQVDDQEPMVGLISIAVGERD